MDYRLFQPQSPSGALLVMLHGCTQNPSDIAACTRFDEWGERHGWLVLYPEQPMTANRKNCWNWFHRDHQRQDRGEAAQIAELTRTIAANHQVERRRIFLAGMSAGAAMAALLALHFPELYRGLGVHSGLPPGAAGNAISALLAMKAVGRAPRGAHIKLPTIVFHGRKDAVVNARNAERLFARVEKPSTEPQFEQQPHYTRTTYPGRAELWMVKELGHAWSGGSPAGSYSDPRPPDASAEMIRFFLEIEASDASELSGGNGKESNPPSARTPQQF